MDIIKKTQNGFVSELNKAVNEVIDGNFSALKLSVIIKTMQTALDVAKSQIDEIALSEAEAYGAKKFNDYGAEFQRAEAGVKYDFSVSTSWNKLQEVIDIARETQKALEKQMKSATTDAPFIDAESGEMITAVPKQSKTIIKISLCKE